MSKALGRYLVPLDKAAKNGHGLSNHTCLLLQDYLRSLKKLVNLALRDLEPPEYACLNCGHLGRDFATIQHDAGDYDLECPDCAATCVEEMPAALGRLTDELDDQRARAERAEEANKTLTAKLEALCPTTNPSGCAAPSSSGPKTSAPSTKKATKS